jgi:hypothetical protein
MITLISNVTAIPVMAGSQPNIQPFWSNTSDMMVVLSITDGKAVLSASVDGYSGVTEIIAVAVLERKNHDGSYTEIERWDDISDDYKWLDWTGTRYVATGYTYRFTFTATVYKNGAGETVSGSKSVDA